MPHSNQSGKVHPAVAALIVIILVGAVASVVIAVQSNQDETTNDATTQTTQGTSNQQSPSSNSSTDVSEYKDGTYSATGSYATPGGMESIDLTVTIENGVITKTELAENATDRDAKQYQAAFASGYEDLVVGKNVDEVSLSRVAGSSLTSNGFNKALDSIKKDAAL